MQKASKIILGIDPGTVVMGYGIIAIRLSKIELLDMGVLKLNAKSDPYQRLEKIHSKVISLIEEFKPQHFAIEAPFFGKNVQSMLKLGRAQGVAIAAAMQCSIEVTEYSPKKIKQSITGNGNASKEQVMKMLQTILHFKEAPKLFDATDALAAAVCHYFQEGKVLKPNTVKIKNWKDFIAAHPKKIK